jgi:hypothetical protein
MIVPMCIMCDGASAAEFLQAIDLRIRVNGSVVVPVVAEGESYGYTIGLLETYGQPELVVYGPDVEFIGSVLGPMIEQIRVEGWLSPSWLSASGVELVDVHANHLGSPTFSAWTAHYGVAPRPGFVRQVLLDPARLAPEPAPLGRRLDRPILGRLTAPGTGRRRRRRYAR